MAFRQPRGLDETERKEAFQVFGNSLNYDKVRIAEDPILSIGGYALTAGNTIYFPPRTTKDKKIAEYPRLNRKIDILRDRADHLHKLHRIDLNGHDAHHVTISITQRTAAVVPLDRCADLIIPTVIVGAAERWRAVRITNFERCQMAALRRDLDHEYEARNAVVTLPQPRITSPNYAALNGLDL